MAIYLLPAWKIVPLFSLTWYNGHKKREPTDCLILLFFSRKIIITWTRPGISGCSKTSPGICLCSVRAASASRFFRPCRRRTTASTAGRGSTSCSRDYTSDSFVAIPPTKRYRKAKAIPNCAYPPWYSAVGNWKQWRPCKTKFLKQRPFVVFILCMFPAWHNGCQAGIFVSIIRTSSEWRVSAGSVNTPSAFSSTLLFIALFQWLADCSGGVRIRWRSCFIQFLPFHILCIQPAENKRDTEWHADSSLI